MGGREEVGGGEEEREGGKAMVRMRDWSSKSYNRRLLQDGRFGQTKKIPAISSSSYLYGYY